ncbi:MAG: hypothetical protein AB7F64_02075 [Gammaproteobacteria bacterium]
MLEKSQTAGVDRDALREKIRNKTSQETKSGGFKQAVHTGMQQPKSTQTPEQHVKLLESLSALVVARYQLILQKELPPEQRANLEQVVLPRMLEQIENNVLKRPISQQESQNLVESLAQKLATTQAQQTGQALPPTSSNPAFEAQIRSQLQSDLSMLLNRPLDQNEMDLVSHSVLSTTNNAVTAIQSNAQINAQALASQAATDPRIGQFHSALDSVLQDTSPSADRNNPAWQQARAQVASQINPQTDATLRQQLAGVLQQYQQQNQTQITAEQSEALFQAYKNAYIDSKANQMVKASSGQPQSNQQSELAFAKDLINNFSDSAIDIVGGIAEPIVKMVAKTAVSYVVQSVLDVIEDAVVDVVLDVVVDVVVDVILDAVIEVIATAIGACFAGVGAIVGAGVGVVIDVIVDAIVDVVLDAVLDVVVDAVIGLVNKFIGHIAAMITDKVVDVIFNVGEGALKMGVKGVTNVGVDALGPQLENMLGQAMGGMTGGGGASGAQQLPPGTLEQIQAALAGSGQNIDKAQLAAQIQQALTAKAQQQGQVAGQTPAQAQSVGAQGQPQIAAAGQQPAIDKSAIAAQVTSALGGALGGAQPAQQTPSQVQSAAVTGQSQAVAVQTPVQAQTPVQPAVTTPTVTTQASGGMTRPPPSQGFEKIEQKVAETTRITPEPPPVEVSSGPGPTKAA